MVAKNWKDQMNGCARVLPVPDGKLPNLPFPSLRLARKLGVPHSSIPTNGTSARQLHSGPQLTQTVVKLYRRDVIQSRSMAVTVRIILPYGKRRYGMMTAAICFTDRPLL